MVVVDSLSLQWKLQEIESFLGSMGPPKLFLVLLTLALNVLFPGGLFGSSTFSQPVTSSTSTGFGFGTPGGTTTSLFGSTNTGGGLFSQQSNAFSQSKPTGFGSECLFLFRRSSVTGQHCTTVNTVWIFFYTFIFCFLCFTAFGTSTSSGGLFGTTSTNSNPFGGTSTSLFGATGFGATQTTGTTLKFNVGSLIFPLLYRDSPVF